MNKQRILKLMLVLLPFMAVALATTGDSVTVFDTQSAVTSNYSYFDLIPVTNLQMCTPLAGMLAVLSTVFAVVSLIVKKPWVLKTLCWMSFGAATAASVPILIRGTVLVIPNVGVPLMLAAQFVICRILMNGSKEPEEKIVSRRLG